MRRRNRHGQAPRYNEGGIVQAIISQFNIPTLYPDTFVWRMETSGSVRRKADGSFMMTKNKYGPGKPDICGVKAGRGFVMEVKMPGEDAKPHQRDWMMDYEERGKGKAFVVHSVIEAEEAWKSI